MTLSFSIHSKLGRREAVIDAPSVVRDIHDRDLATATCNEHGVTQLVLGQRHSRYRSNDRVGPIRPETAYTESQAMVQTGQGKPIDVDAYNRLAMGEFYTAIGAARTTPA